MGHIRISTYCRPVNTTGKTIRQHGVARKKNEEEIQIAEFVQARA